MTTEEKIKGLEHLLPQMPRRDHCVRSVKADPCEQEQHPRGDRRGQAHRICLPRQAADQQSRLY